MLQLEQFIPTRLRDKFRSQDERTRNANKNTIWMFLFKGLSMLITLMYAPLLIDQMTRTNYGIWLTLSSLVGWFSFMDIGLGNGLRNYLAKAIAEDDTRGMKSLVATAYATMSAIAGVVISAVLCSFWFINWSKLLNAPLEMNSELTILAIIAVVCFFLNFVLRLLNSILLAVQKPAYSSYLGLACHAAAFLIVLALSQTGRQYPLLVYGSIISIIPVAGLFFYTIFLFNTKLSYLKFSVGDVKYSSIKPLFNLGFRFFLIQLTAVLLFQANNLIIAHVSGPEYVADYNIAYQYLNVLCMFYNIVLVPVWSSSTDAYYRGDYEWIRRTLKNLKKLWLLCLFGGMCMVALAPYVYKIWLGGLIHVDFKILWLVLIYVYVSMLCGAYCGIINGIGKIKLQFYITVAESLVHIPLAILLGLWLGIYGVLISMCLVTIVNAFWEPIQIHRLLNNTASGIWNS